MAPLTKLKIPILVILAFLAMPAFVPSSSVDLQNTSKISYNAPEGDIVHAPLSGMGLITIALMRNLTATPDFFKITTVGSTAPGGSSNSQTGLKTIRQNALRFVNDTSYLPQTETLAASQHRGNGVILAKSNSRLFDPAVSCLSAFYTPNANSCWIGILLYESPFFSGGLEDRHVIAVGRRSSPYSGSVYVAWNH